MEHKRTNKKSGGTRVDLSTGKKVEQATNYTLTAKEFNKLMQQTANIDYSKVDLALFGLA